MSSALVQGSILIPARFGNRSRLVDAVAIAAVCSGTAILLHSLWRRVRRTRLVRIERLFVYPIKGCRGHSVLTAGLTPLGLEGDRVYMVVDQEMKFVTQRTHPVLALVHPELVTAAGVTLRCLDPVDKTMSAPKQPPLFVPRLTEKLLQVHVWSDEVLAVDQGDEAAAWFQAVLGMEGARLVHIHDDAHRATNSAFGIGETTFSDGFPLLLTSVASLDDVARRVKDADISIERFRPNVHVSGCRAFDEDEMRGIVFTQFGGDQPYPGEIKARLQLVKPCSRCTVPTIQPNSGTRTAQGEPLRSLRHFRCGTYLSRWAWLHRRFFRQPDQAEEAFFGQNVLPDLTVLAPGARLAVGDVALVEW